MKTKRASIDPLTLTIIGGACIVGIFVPNWRPWNWSVFKKQPPTQQLKVDVAELEKAKAAQADAEAKLQAVKDAQEAKRIEELRYAQQMAEGASNAIARVKEPHRTDEIILAEQLINRCSAGLNGALGKLTQEQREEIFSIVAKSLSTLANERDEARAALQKKDVELQISLSQKEILEKQIPDLAKKADEAQKTLKQKEVDVANKTSEVISYAEKLNAKEKENGSLQSQFNNLIRIFAIMGIIWGIVHYVIPSLAQEFPALKILSLLNKALKSIFSSHA